MKKDYVILFSEYMTTRRLAKVTIESYLYYIALFKDRFTQEKVNSLISKRNNTALRSAIKILIDFVKVYKDQLELSEEEYNRMLSLFIPKSTGRKKKKTIKPLSEEQVILLSDNMENEKYKLMVLLTFYCGFRVGELLKMSVNAFNWEVWGQDIEQQGEVVVFGKGNSEGIAIVPPWLMKNVARYVRSNKLLSPNSRLFTKEFGYIDVHNRVRVFQTKIKKAGVKSGITLLDQNGEVIEETKTNPHRLRHSYGYYLVKKGLDIRYIQEALRHRDISNTQIYTYVDKKDLKEKLRFED